MKTFIKIFIVLLIPALIVSCGTAVNPSASPTATDTVSTAPTETTAPDETISAAANDNEPFNESDIDALAGDFLTVRDYVDVMKPTAYSWSYEGAATGNTYITAQNNMGSVTLIVYAETINGEQYGDGETALDDDTLALDASLYGARWMDSSFEIVDPVRGIKVGATRGNVLGAFLNKDNGNKLYEYTDIDADAKPEYFDWRFIGGEIFPDGTPESGNEVIRYGWCDLSLKNEWKYYYELAYYIENGMVTDIQYIVSNDPE